MSKPWLGSAPKRRRPIPIADPIPIVTEKRNLVGVIEPCGIKRNSTESPDDDMTPKKLKLLDDEKDKRDFFKFLCEKCPSKAEEYLVRHIL